MSRHRRDIARPRRRTPPAFGLVALVGAIAAAVSVVSIPRTLLAQSSAADVSLGRQLGNEGLALAASGDCAGAVEKLKRAEGLHHAPTTLTVLGECHVTLGNLVDGVEELTRVVREDLGRSPPAAFRKAQARARLKLDAARPRLPKLRLTVEGVSADASMVIRIDGQTVPAATLGLDRPVDPGEHDVEVSAAGYKTASVHLTAKEGASQALNLTLEPLPPADLPPEPVAAAPPTSRAPASASTLAPPPERRAPERSASYVPAGVLLGIGGAGIGVGAVLGLMTLTKTSHLSTVCQPKSACPSSEQGTIDSASTLALGSTIGFGVGVLAAGFGIYFLFAPPTSERAPRAAGVTVRPWVGPGSAGLTGAF